MTPLEPQYLAGLFDGEGCVSLARGRGNWIRQLHVGITWQPTVEQIKQQYGGNIYTPNKQKDSHKQTHTWIVTRKRDIVKFLGDILPYLHEKKEQAEIMHRLCLYPNMYHLYGKDKIDLMKEHEWSFQRLKELKLVQFVKN